MKKNLLLVALLTYASYSTAATYVLPSQGSRIGEIEYVLSEVGETLSEAGLRYDIGFNEMVKANPKVNKYEPFSSSVQLLIPSQFNLPNTPRKGLVIDLTQYRLFYYPPHENVVYTFPVGIGRKGWNTPVGQTTIISKERNPIWRPSIKLRNAAAEKGMMLPETFPPSAANPLGSYALRLGWSSYLIHGTNKRDGVGMKVSAGCIRMLPEDIEQLFQLVQTHTPVLIINHG